MGPAVDVLKDLAEMHGVLFFGDNLPILRNYLPDESVDLIYLDPPFNSKAEYNVIFKETSTFEPSKAQIKAFEDTWHWGEESQAAFEEVLRSEYQKTANLLRNMIDALGYNDATAYLAMMTVRLLELHRVLKPTGSLFLHCDPTMSHYLKVILDSIFGAKNFRNEIIWKRTSFHKTKKKFGRVHDVILFYSKDADLQKWREVYIPYEEAHEKTFRYSDERGKYGLADLTGKGIRGGESGKPWRGYDPTQVGRHWAVPNWLVEKLVGRKRAEGMGVLEKLELLYRKGYIVFSSQGVPQYKKYLDDMPGVPAHDVWTDIPPLSAQSKERLGYPTQKPLKLLKRIIEATTDEGDVVLDPFCGCGTAVVAAEQMGRKWVGIDITHLAINLIKARLGSLGLSPGKHYAVYGEPADLESARALAQKDRFEFEYWALSLLPPARPVKSKGRKRKGTGPDEGYDGVFWIVDREKKKTKYKKIVLQVKSGKVGVKNVREFLQVIDRQGAAAGIFITLQEPTRQMKSEAISAGKFTHEATRKEYPKLQIITVEELLKGKRPELPWQWAIMERGEVPPVPPGNTQNSLY